MVGPGLDLVVEGDGKWTPFPVWDDGDPGPWAADVVDALSARRQVPITPSQRTVIVQTWAAMVEDVRSRRSGDGTYVASAYGFVPMGSVQAGDLVPMSVAQLSGLSGEDGLTLDQVLEQLVQPPALRVADPLVDELDTASGTALRVRQLLRSPVPGRPDSVASSLVYLWQSPVDGVVVSLDTWFASPTEARLVEPSFDALAATLRMQLDQ